MAIDRPMATLHPAVEIDAKSIQPAPGLVAVRRAEAVTKSSGGIILAEAAVEVQLQGEIVGLGRMPLIIRPDGQWAEEPNALSLGDQVSYRYAKGSLIKIQGEDILVMPYSEILGVLS